MRRELRGRTSAASLRVVNVHPALLPVRRRVRLRRRAQLTSAEIFPGRESHPWSTCACGQSYACEREHFKRKRVRPRQCKRYLRRLMRRVALQREKTGMSPFSRKAQRFFFFGGRLARSFLMRRSRRSLFEVLRPRFSLGLSPTKGLTSLRNSTETGVANRSNLSRNTLAR